MEELINKTINYIEDFFKEDYSGHDFYHSLRVYKLAKKIAENEQCDLEIVCLSALLHDVDDYKLVGEQTDKYQNAKKFLKSLNYHNSRIDLICHIISQVSFKGNNIITPDTIEGKIVQDADRLDAIGAIGIGRTFTYSGNHNIPMHIPNMPYRTNMNEKSYKVASSTINHFYEKLLKLKELMNTKKGKEMAIHRHEFMEKYLKEFYDEWEMKN